jgi:hypothetical protein
MAKLSKSPCTENVDIQQWGGLESVETAVGRCVDSAVAALKADLSSSIHSGMEDIIKSALTEITQAIFDDDISCEMLFYSRKSRIEVGFKVNNSSDPDVFLQIGLSELISDFIARRKSEGEELSGMALALRTLADKVEASIVADDA